MALPGSLSTRFGNGSSQTFFSISLPTGQPSRKTGSRILWRFSLQRCGGARWQRYGSDEVWRTGGRWRCELLPRGCGVTARWLYFRDATCQRRRHARWKAWRSVGRHGWRCGNIGRVPIATFPLPSLILQDCRGNQQMQCGSEGAKRYEWCRDSSCNV